MTEPHRALIARLHSDFAVVSAHMARISADLTELDRLLSAPQPAPSWTPPATQYPPERAPQHVPTPVVRKRSGGQGWIGKLLAVAGVAVTLIGVVLLLVLAAQAGLLRPEVRVAAGVVLAVALVGAGAWLHARPGGRLGAVALTATGVAAAYMDLIAVTAIYGWLAAPFGLLTAAVIGGGGLMLARRWDSEHLGLLVLVPLIVLAPVVVGSVTLLLVGFMLALAAASLPVQLGKDWKWLHCARIAAATLPLLAASVAVSFDDGHEPWLVGASAIAALLAIAAALILLPHSTNRLWMAVTTVVGVLPVWCVTLVADRVIAALMAAALATALAGIAICGDRFAGVDKLVRRVWLCAAALSALIAVLVAFDGHVAGPVLLGMAVVVGVAGRREKTARWASIGFAACGAAFYLSYTPPDTLLEATELGTAATVSTLVASVLLTVFATVTVWAFSGRDPVVWAGAAVVTGYALTTFAVTAGVAVGGSGWGFFAGHMVATIGWIVMAAALFGYASRLPKTARSLPIAGGLALVAAATAKLFLFDLGNLDGMFRVTVFIVVGLMLLAIGAGYARLLDKQDQQAARQT